MSSIEVYPQGKVIQDYVDIDYDYFALHQKYVSEDNMAGCRVLHTLHKNRELPLKSRAEVVEEVVNAQSEGNTPNPMELKENKDNPIALTFEEILAAQKKAAEESK